MLTDWLLQRQVPLRAVTIALLVIGLSAFIGLRSSQFTDFGSISMESVAPMLVVAGILAAFGLAVVDLRFALVVLIVTAGWIDIPLGTGTQTNITTVMLILPTIGAAWVLQALVGKRAIPLGDTRLNRPIVGFLAILVVSWLASSVVMDVRVPLPGNAFLVQSTQAAIFVLSFAAMLLAASVRWSERLLKIAVAATIAMAMLAVVVSNLSLRPLGPVSIATPMAIGVVLLLGQLILNRRLGTATRVAGWGLAAFWAAGTFLTFRFAYAGGWVPVVVAVPVLLWLRSRRVAVGASAIGALLLWSNRSIIDDFLAFKGTTGSLLRPYIWWDVASMTFDSPWHVIMGLGPVNYKWNWFNPDFVSLSRPLTGNSYVGVGDASVYYSPPSHNFFADLYAQSGIAGVLAFGWLLTVLVIIAWRLIERLPEGFARAYAGSVLAGLVGMTAVSVVSAEWLVPFVYNLGTAGFRQSIYIWFLLGTLVSMSRFGLAAAEPDAAPTAASHA